MINVAGGVYREICELPRVEEIFGSAGRAAVALASFHSDVVLHSYGPSSLHDDIRAAIESGGVAVNLHCSRDQITFRYLHPMATPTFGPQPRRSEQPIRVTGDTVLRFGMMETDAIIDADRAVYDPQSSSATYRENGSTANDLAVVLNSRELRERIPTAEDEADAVVQLAAREQATVVVVKAGAVGARIYENGVLSGSVTPFRTDRVYKIGSGDMFTAGFTHAWAMQGRSAVDAGEYASRSAAQYCQTRNASLLSDAQLAHLTPVNFVEGRKVYVAGPFFTTSDLWMVEEICRSLRDIGATPVSPYHDIGVGPPQVVAPKDIEAICSCDAVLAVVSHGDPGTLFEIGYSRSIGKAVVALAENTRSSDLSMLEGTGCIIARDVATAVYRAAWASWA